MQNSRENLIYADANSTLPVSAQHWHDLTTLVLATDGNPSSIHSQGRSAKIALEHARGQLAALIGARSTEIVFTSGATEANNMLIQGVIGRLVQARLAEVRTQSRGERIPRVVATSIEHSSVLEVLQVMAERQLCRLEFAPVNSDGLPIVEECLSLVCRAEDPADLVCLMQVNNETGMICPVDQIAKAIKQRLPHCHIHCDAVQSLGRLDTRNLCKGAIDSASFSGHKVGALKGTGALWLKSGVKLARFAMGGGQERSRRPGTENLPGILSFGIRAHEIVSTLEWLKFETELRSFLVQLISELKTIDGLVIHGDPERSVANTVNFHIEGVAGDDLLLNLDLAGIAASSGSACSSGAGRPSHVLLAMGYSEQVALNSVRLSFGARGSTGDLQRIVRVLKETVSRVKSSGVGNVREPTA